MHLAFLGAHHVNLFLVIDVLLFVITTTLLQHFLNCVDASLLGLVLQTVHFLMT